MHARGVGHRACLLLFQCDSTKDSFHKSTSTPESRPLHAVWHRPTRITVQRPQPERAHETTYKPTTQPLRVYHHQPLNSRLHSSNCFISTCQPLLCKPASRSGKNNGRLQPTSTQNYDSRVVTHCCGVRQCALDTPPPRQRNICGATAYLESKNCMCGATICHLGHIDTPHYDELWRFRGETERRQHELCSG